MKQEQVIELAEKYGATSYRHRSDTANPAYGFTGTQLSALLNSVEQATLERAAVVCESWRGGKLLLNAGEMSADELRTFRAVTIAAACEIRNLAKEAQ